MRGLVFLALVCLAHCKWPVVAGPEAEAVPASFDCGMRKLAYTYGQQLLPRMGKFESLFYALGLNDECDGEMSEGPSYEARVVELPLTAVYVDPVKGSDSNSGSESSPVKTIQHAADIAGQQGNVVLRGGTYHVSESIMLTEKHSGLTISAYPKELPVVSGGKSVTVDWKPYNVSKGGFKTFANQNNVWDAVFDNKTIVLHGKTSTSSACQSVCESIQECTSYTWHDAETGKYANDCVYRTDGEWAPHSQTHHFSGSKTPGKNIYVTNIQGQVSDVPGLQIEGVRATRARYPNLPGGIEVSPMYGAMIPGGSASWTPPDLNKYGPVTYYTDEVHLRNDSTLDKEGDVWFEKYMIGIKGLCSIYEPPVSYWCSAKTAGGGAFAFRTPGGVTPKPGVLPNAPYKDASDAIINVWRPSRWANWMFEVKSYDSHNNNFTFGRGGFQGARGNNKGGDFFVENLFEELDNPGEFYFNKKTGDLYLFHNGTGAPPTDNVVVPQTQVLVNITGNRWNAAKDITITGVKFTATSYTYMNPHGVPSAGDWALDRYAAVFMQNTEFVSVTHSLFERLDGNAVMFAGYNRNATVADSDFSFIGGNCVAAWGDTNETSGEGHPKTGIDGTDGNHPRYSQVLRNSGREIGLYEKQSSFFVMAKTAQTYIAGNVFFNGPRAGINANDGFGGGDEITNNLVFSTCRESGDHGPFNSWDRQPFITTVRTGEPSLIMAWREIHHNFFIDNYSPQENVDNDDGSCYYKTHHNFLVYGNRGLKNDFGGHDNRHYGNIYAYVGECVMASSMLDGHEAYFYDNKAVVTGEKVGSPQCHSPGKTIMHDNEYFTSDGKISECGSDLPVWQHAGNDKNSTVAKIPADATILGWASELLSIK